MLITSFSVKNFRSIIKTSALPIYNLSILIGPNNEGKSNILQALVLTLRNLSDIDLYYGMRRFRSRYIDKRDQKKEQTIFGKETFQ